MKARLTPASGALEGAKSDLVRDDFRFESKATANDSISLKMDWLLKIKHEALTTSRKPALVISFVNGDGSPRKAGSWVCMKIEDFNELIGI